MLLLLLLGAVQNAPVVNGVRAYGHTTYRAVSDSTTAESSVTNAQTTEE